MQASLARRISEIMFPGGAGSSGMGFMPVKGKKIKVQSYFNVKVEL